MYFCLRIQDINIKLLLMNKTNKHLLCLILLLSGCINTNTKTDTINYLPQTPKASKIVDSFSLIGKDESLLLAALSLQGIVNRDEARIYTHVDQDKWVLDLYKKEGYIETENSFADIYELLDKYKSYYIGAVVYDPEKDYTVNLATNIAGVENRIIISPDMIDRFKSCTGKSDIKDLRDQKFTDAASAFKWYKKNVFPQQNHTVLSVAKGLLFMYDVYRDYLVEFKIPVFWLPGKNDNDYDADYENEIIRFLEETPANIPILGFWPGVDKSGKNIGYEEYDGVKLAGKYGKFTLVNTWVGNYSFHSALHEEGKEYKQLRVKDKQFREFDPSKKYVALIMNESGDAPCYFLYTGFYPRQWNDPYRGKVAISYGITPSLRMLAPAVLNNMYETQTANDYFFTSISGAGYCYPFEGLHENTSDPSGNLKKYFSDITASNMKIMDLDMLGIYTHPQQKWNQEDYRIANQYMSEIPGLVSVISGMHRTEFTAEEANGMLDNQASVHHTMTFWSHDNLKWNDEAMDEIAVDHLEKELKTYGEGNNFIQAMFYSWHYGPRRLYKLQERLEKEGYEFLTLNEFDYLWRKSNEY